MASAHASILLRHIRSLVAVEERSRLSDRQLLQHFLTSPAAVSFQDTKSVREAAFEALLRRHGPLVWGVCRRVLHHWHDAEDVFQATFFVLARKAGSISKRESVGSWLHKVAFRLALKARARTARRKTHERPAEPLISPPPPTGKDPGNDPLAEVTGRELLAALDEELQRLPERYRAPLVICYLQGKTCDQAARHLGWSQRTLKRRLEQGRDHLRTRLARRGLTLSSGLLTTALAGNAASAELPTILLHATAKAGLAFAAGQPEGAALVSAEVASLAQGAIKAMVAAKVKVAIGVLLGIGVIGVGTSFLTYQVLAEGSQGTKAQTQPPRSTPESKKQVKQLALVLEDVKNKPNSQPTSNQVMTVKGRVLDEDGRPVPFAQVAVCAGVRRLERTGGLRSERTVLAHATADREGWFHLNVNRTSSLRNWSAEVIAASATHGLGWQSFDPDAERPEMVVRLPGGAIIKGKLLDLQGQPAAGVKLEVTQIRKKQKPEAKPPVDQDMRLMRHNMFLDRQEIFFQDPPGDLPLWPSNVTTDRKGRFVFWGLGRSLEVTLNVRDDRFASQQLMLQAIDKDPAEIATRSLTPGRLIEGRVTYSDTGKPVANAEVGAWGIKGRTDQEGRFRLHASQGVSGFNGQPADQEIGILLAYSPEGEPYLHRQKQFIWPKGAVKHTIDIALPRGVLVRGKVVEAGSNMPVPGAHIHYQAQFTNPNLKTEELSGNNFANGKNATMTGPDGKFQIACVAGPGYLVIEGPDPDYVRRERGGYDQLFSGKPGGQPWYAHGFVALNLKRDSQPSPFLVKLERGVTLKGSVVGPNGSAAIQPQVLCQLQGFATQPVKVRGSRFELRGLDPTESYRVHFLDSKKGWGGTMILSAKQSGNEPVTVRIAPLGSAKVRFLDAQGKPLENFYPGLFLVLTPQTGNLREDTLQIYSPFEKNGPHTDTQGHWTVSGLIPGATYHFGYAEIEKRITPETGKTVDLGDIVVKQPQ